MPIPNIANQEVNGLLRASPPSSSLVCVLGTSSAGSVGFPWVGARVTDLVSANGYGPGPELAAMKCAASQQVVFIKLPIASAGSAGSVTSTNPGTSAVTVTGTPYENLDVALKFSAGATIGVAGAKFQYSLNGGLSYSLTYSLGTANTFVIPNTGLTVNFGAGTVLSNSVFMFSTVEPAPDAAGIQAAFDLIKVSSLPIDCVVLANNATPTLVTAMKTGIEGIKPFGKHVWGLAGAPIPTPSQTDSQYSTAMDTAYTATASDKLGVCMWSALYSSAISGLTFERSPLFPALNVLTPADISENSASIAGHAVPCLLADDTTGVQVGHDALYDESLSDRFITLRTWPGQPGVYITRARLLSAPADSAQLIIHRRLVNRGEQAADRYMATIVHTPIRVQAANGHITDDEKLRIQDGMQSAQDDALVGHVSNVKYVLDSSINMLTTSRLEGDLYIQPFGYPEYIITRIALTATIEA